MITRVTREAQEANDKAQMIIDQDIKRTQGTGLDFKLTLKMFPKGKGDDHILITTAL